MKKLFAVILILLLITVNVSAASTSDADIMRIDIQAKPEKYEYLRGEALDLTDLYITVTYDNGASEKVQVSPDMLSGYNANELGAQVITVVYKNRSTSFSVKVVEEYSTERAGAETIEFDTSPETHAPDEKEGEPSKVIIITAVAVAAAASAVCIAAIIKKPKKEDEK